LTITSEDKSDEKCCGASLYFNVFDRIHSAQMMCGLYDEVFSEALDFIDLYWSVQELKKDSTSIERFCCSHLLASMAQAEIFAWRALVSMNKTCKFKNQLPKVEFLLSQLDCSGGSKTIRRDLRDILRRARQP
jgi:hypothetical protein